jgi:hypothetical protein
MQHDVDTVATAHAIRILGINKIGEDRDNALICEGRTIPWLQDIPLYNVWDSWHVTWRDVFVLDADNRIVTIYNLTTNDLSDSTRYAELRAILLQAAGKPAPSAHAVHL